MARAVVFAVISWFFFKAAIEYDPQKARRPRRRAAQDRAQPYDVALLRSSPWLFAYGVFCVIQARYREVYTTAG